MIWQMNCPGTGYHHFFAKCPMLIAPHPLYLILFYSGYYIPTWTGHPPAGRHCSVLLFTRHSPVNKTDLQHSTYNSALRKFAEFCAAFKIISPFPVSESILCYFSSYLATKHLSPLTIRTYLSGIRHMQIVLGLPEPRAFSSLPRIRLVQSGIQRVYAQKTTPKTRIRLPITPSILAKIHTHMLPKSSDHDTIMIWAAATICFFGFFRSGEITLPAGTSFDDTKHLSWGDVAVDNPALPQIVKVRLKVSKSDQLRKGVDVFIGKTGGVICPVAAVLAYMAARGG